MRTVAALLAMSLVGCSFAMPPGGRGGRPAACRAGAPIADTVLAAAGYGVLVFAATSTPEEDRDEDPYGIKLLLFGLPGAVVGTVFLSSAIYGLYKYRRCAR